MTLGQRGYSIGDDDKERTNRTGYHMRSKMTNHLQPMSPFLPQIDPTNTSA